ncbi:MAG: hypothetical protein IH595_06870 [Bacteroidales bacterium]|nr:hypothetical protein [Bacteroidales bacterium]
MKLKSNSIYLLITIALFGLFNWQCLKSTHPGIPQAVRKTISSSGINSPELMKTIVHYTTPADSDQLKALYWLLGNMDGNYSVQYSVEDSTGNKYRFPPSKYMNYDALEHAWDSTEDIVGQLSFHADSFWMDQKQIKSSFLINNIDEAYKAYKTFPWDKAYNFSQFCKWILPYRCDNEPVEPFRRHFLEEYGSYVKNSPDTNIIEIANLLNKLVNQKIHYMDSYNKDSNVQTIEQLEKSGYGNFYDVNIYKVKVMRSFGIAAILDYTPFLADTSFGYAWTTVFLPDSSELRLEFPSRVRNLDKPGRLAKVYRRTFEKIKTGLFARKNIDEATPPFLGDYYYQDITDSLTSKTVRIRCNEKVRYAYLAVFNDGNWHPVSWAIPEKDSIATFRHMGTHIVYLPVSLQKHHLFLLGDPFIFDEKGIQHSLAPDFSKKQNVFLSKTNSYQKILQGTYYTLYVWEGKWKPLFSFTGDKKALKTNVPLNGLFLLTDNKLPKKERIFVVNQSGKQIFY